LKKKIIWETDIQEPLWISTYDFSTLIL